MIMKSKQICVAFLFWITVEFVVESSGDSVKGIYDAKTSTLLHDERPNIILLLTDDQDVLIGGVDQMPNLQNLLIEKGLTFQNAFVHTPICCPSRSSILSGRYLHNGKFINNSLTGNCNGPDWQEDAEQHTFAVYAQSFGYLTSYAGKYLNQYGVAGSPGCDVDRYPNDKGCSRVPPGWNKWLGLEGNSVYYKYNVIKSDDGGLSSHRLSHGDDYELDYLPDLVTNRTIDMINQFTSTKIRKPFLIVNAWPSPHAPFTSAPWAQHMYDGAKAHRTKNWNASSEYMQQKHWIMRRLAPIDTATEIWIDNAYEHRLEALRSVDNHLRDIVNMLEVKGELNRTIIIYTSDNGFQLGQHRLQTDKRHLYEHDIRVPFIAIGPRVPANSSTNHIVLNIDIAPTIYELVTGSCSPPETMDGSSFASLLLGKLDFAKQHFAREDFLISYNGEGFAACGMSECPPVPASEYHGGPMPDSINNTYHCLRTLSSGEVNDEKVLDSIYCRFDDDETFVEYYDLTVDPWQLSNAYLELNAEKRKYFETRLAKLLQCRGESCRSNNSSVTLL